MNWQIRLTEFKQNWVDIIGILHNTISNNSLYVNNAETVFQACQIAGRYKFSFYDSMIISSALLANCSILFTEDLHDGQIIDGLVITNPFLYYTANK